MAFHLRSVVRLLYLGQWLVPTVLIRSVFRELSYPRLYLVVTSTDLSAEIFSSLKKYSSKVGGFVAFYSYFTINFGWKNSENVGGSPVRNTRQVGNLNIEEPIKFQFWGTSGSEKMEILSLFLC